MPSVVGRIDHIEIFLVAHAQFAGFGCRGFLYLVEARFSSRHFKYAVQFVERLLRYFAHSAGTVTVEIGSQTFEYIVHIFPLPLPHRACFGMVFKSNYVR